LTAEKVQHKYTYLLLPSSRSFRWSSSFVDMLQLYTAHPYMPAANSLW